MVEYHLVVAKETVEIAGAKATKLTVNGGIPGPVLRFREGDTARIHLHNRLPQCETLIHWHGLLVPVSEDGVPGVTTDPVPPGGVRTYEFPIRQAGTYWYHSHSGLQEQEGVYGAIVIEPRGRYPVQADRDAVLVLSDYTREPVAEVMRTLMRMSGADWYAFRKGNRQTLAGAARAGRLADWWKREWARMPSMDISDVAYDAFLVNGRPETAIPARPGERIRLRVINAAASTYFYIDSATGPLTITATDGQDVQPLGIPRLFIGMGETYDLLLTVPGDGAWEVRATAQDGSGHASAWIGAGQRHAASGPPGPDLYATEEVTSLAIEDLDGGTALSDNPRPGSPWRSLRSLRPTGFSAALPRRTVRLHLTGDMERYLWTINGRTAREETVIPVRYGEVLRLELVNDTMMHHPMHLHGHFFRVVSPQGDYSPLKHTVDVPPMGRRTIEFAANETGDWLFHCHLLYHMHMGMARVLSYDNQGADHRVAAGEHGKDLLYLLLEGDARSNMSMGMVSLMNSRNDFILSWDAAYGDGLDDMHTGEDVEYEIDLVWQRYIDPNLSTFLGGRLTNEMDAVDRAIGGIRYRLPLLVQSSLGIDSEGDVRIGLEKELPLTDRLTVSGSVRYDSGTKWEWDAEASWLLNKPFSLVAGYHSMHGFGAGIAFRF